MSRAERVRGRARGAEIRSGQLERLLAERERELAALAARLILAEERQRQSIAEGLHDEIGQSLAVAKVRLTRLRQAVASDEDARALVELIGLIDEVIASTRSLTFSLSSPLLHRLGLVAALDNLARRMAREHGFELCVESTPGVADRVSPRMGTLLFRSVRELLCNVVKHAQARRVDLSLRAGAGGLEIAVADDGKGFEVAAHGARLEPGAGFGLFSIRQALIHEDGCMEIESSPGSGTRVVLTVPVDG